MLRAVTRKRCLLASTHRLLSATPIENATQTTDLKDVLKEKIPEKQAEVKQVRTEHGEKTLGNVTVNMCLRGMRGIPGLLWETSLLDPDEGIRFRSCS